MRIGLYLQNLDEEYQISVYKGIRAEAERLGIDIFCIQRALIEKTGTIGLDGILLLSSVLFTGEIMTDDSRIRGYFGSTPCVSIGNHIPGIPSIIIRNKNSMERLMDHLVLDHGYRKFLYIGGPKGHRDNSVRERVFRETLKKRLQSRPDLEGTVTNGGFSESLAMQIMRDYVRTHEDSPPDAVVAANDNMAIGVLKVLHTLPGREWERCAVTGFDDTPRARLERPALTTVRQPLDEMGQLAVRTIRDLMLKLKVPDIQHIDSSLVVRDSCGCRPAANDAAPVTDEQLSRIEYRNIQFEQYLRYVSLFGQALTTTGSMRELVGLLQTFLNANDIRTFFLLLYPPREKADSGNINLVYRRFGGEEQSFADGPVRTTMGDFFAGDFRTNGAVPAATCVYHLRSGTEEIGLIVYESEDFAQPHICSGAIFMANTVKRLMILEDEKERSLLLENEVRLRTQDLVEMNRQLKKESRQRLAVEAEVLRISEMERLRFSLDLHDDICQRLAGISMFSKSLAKGADLTELSEMIDETLLRTRQYAHDSFPFELDSLGLENAIGSLCHSIQKQTGCACALTWDVPDENRITGPQRINLYRIVQEAMNNVVKHSGATKASVSFGMKDRALVVAVRDNGKGVSARAIEGNPPQAKRNPHVGIGLKSMEYRANQIGAKYLLKSSEKKGTLVEIRLPL